MCAEQRKLSGWKSPRLAGFCFVFQFVHFLSLHLHYVPILAPPWLPFYFQHCSNYSAGKKQCAINMPALYTEPILTHIHICIMERRQFLCSVFVNTLHPGVCWMILATNILFHSCIAEYFSAVWVLISLCFICQKMLYVTDKEKEMYWRNSVGGHTDSWEDTLKREPVDLM